MESVREGKTVRQRTVKALGRKDALAASGELAVWLRDLIGVK